MKPVHLVILQLCFVFVPCARLTRKQLEQRIQAIQTLTMQDMQIVKEFVKNNAEGIKKIESKLDDLSKIICKTSSMVQNGNDQTAKVGDETNSGAPYDQKTQIIQSDIKRLQRAFQEQKLYSTFLQVNTLNQIEKQDSFMKNISTHLAKSKSQSCNLSENLKAKIENLASCATTDRESATGTSSVEYRDILIKAETILKEVIKGRSAIKDSLSAISNRNIDPENGIAASCFKVVYRTEPDVIEHNDHECLNISAHRDKKVTFHCGNRNIRLGDAKITEVAVEGRVEIRYNNHWGTVCRDGFEEKEARVACRSSGFARGVVERRVPEGKGQIWLDDLSCNGEEHNLFECKRRYGIGGHDCTHYGDAGVRCFWLP